ncbi:uncharacterized protein LOC136038289 [Artemia franciscana]|uniref:uncharacterized protein LOC136038289 n=1 Tax=Artemia franciscana TaxID=6661 RepID=UPI0032DAAEC8
METKGFNLGDTPETKVSQKWRNLWALYKGYVKKLESVTGAGLETLEDTPPYIDEIRDIVGQSLAVHPSFVADSCGLDPSEYSSKNFSERLANRGGASIEGQGGSSSFLETEIGRDVSAADDSFTPSPKTQRSSRLTNTQKALQLLEENKATILDYVEYRKRRDEDRDKERKKTEEEREQRREQRHQEKMQLKKEFLEEYRKKK